MVASPVEMKVENEAIPPAPALIPEEESVPAAPVAVPVAAVPVIQAEPEQETDLPSVAEQPVEVVDSYNFV